MLSLVRVNAGQASHYYTADDYYLQNVGHWQGELATSLGFNGDVKVEDFQSLIKGIDPQGRFIIQSGGKEYKHTAGVDLTFSAPKSVSIVGLVLDDRRVIDAHNKAVTETLNYIEKNYTNVRVKKDEVVHMEKTGNMLAAKFQHVSSRELDPQLHTHCLVMNFTRRDDNKIRAMDYREIYDTKMLLGQIYRSELAANLKDIGYSIDANSKGLFEIKGIGKELIAEFSIRREQIKRRLVELKEKHPNKNEAELKAMAAISTRKLKDEPSMGELKNVWDKTINELKIDKNSLAVELKSQQQTPKDINKIIDRSLHIATEHNAVVERDEVLHIAARISVGDFRIDDINKALDDNKEIINLGNDKLTTFEIAELERKLIKRVEDGKNQAIPLQKSLVQNGIMHYEADNGFKLTKGQKEAVFHTFSSSDSIIAIQGDAGTGKTTMLDVVRTIAEKNNYEVVGLSFTGKAASEIDDASKIESRTIASLVASNDDLRGKLVVLDEASMLSIKDMQAVLNKCDEKSKLVLIGDTKQLQTIGQGKIFSSLQDKKIISTVRMSEVQRQTNAEYKDVVNKLGDKKVIQALNKLNVQGKIAEVKEYDDRMLQIIDKYLENPKDTIIVTATNKDRLELNKLIRERSIYSGEVSSEGQTYLTRQVKAIIGTEKYYAESYDINNVIVANKSGIIGKAGSEGKVINVDLKNNTITIAQCGIDKKIQKTIIDLKDHGGDLQVYTEKKEYFAKGDKIIFLKNDRGLNVKNGQTAVISEINKYNVIRAKLDNGKEISFNPTTQYKYIDYGYALTDYKSQGLTAKHVIYHADTGNMVGVNYQQAYVCITRGKESVSIITDDIKRLLTDIQWEQNKSTTLEYGLNMDKLKEMRQQNSKFRGMER
jgi:conjugative relaxase-like TrwC/TraI family protein